MKLIILRFISIFAALTVLAGLVSCITVMKSDKTVFGLDISGAEVISDTDSHGGWLGDGERFMIVKFNETPSVFPDGWRPLPADSGTVRAIWGTEDENGRYGPYILAEIPRVTSGMYCFADRSPDGHHYLNLTAAVYDFDTDMLYYVVMDS